MLSMITILEVHVEIYNGKIMMIRPVASLVLKGVLGGFAIK